MMHHQTPAPTNAGFSLVELVLIVGVMAILVTISFGSIFSFLDRQKETNENAQLTEIRRALESYARETGELPLDNTDGATVGNQWFDILSAYSNLSAEEIRYDNWNSERIYKSTSVAETYRETEFNVYYATVYSEGSNLIVDSDAGIVPSDVNGNVIEDEGATSSPVWWDAADGDELEDYADFEVAEDDMAIKFTDLQIKTGNYELSRKRMNDITQALQNYADTKVNEALVTNAQDLAAGNPETYPNIEDMIFYPPANTRPGDPADAATYMDQVWVDADNYLGNGNGTLSEPADRVVVDENDDRGREASLVNLMRLLGLPDSHCCNPLEIREDASGRYERPFFYFSNPRPRVAGNTCGSRPSSGPFLPPRLTSDFVTEGGTELPTCG